MARNNSETGTAQGTQIWETADLIHQPNNCLQYVTFIVSFGEWMWTNPYSTEGRSKSKGAFVSGISLI